MGQGNRSQSVVQALVLHNLAGWARAGIKAKGHKPRIKGPRGMYTPSHLILSLQISRLFREDFYYIAYR